jgi:hypothetical protein
MTWTRPSVTLEDWQPGDGLVCSYAKRSPVPCGRPVKTAVSEEDGGPRRARRIMRRPLCQHHAKGRISGVSTSVIRAQAETNAWQRLAHEHWEEWQGYLADEIDRLMKLPGDDGS